MGNTDIFIDDDALNLIEGIFVCCIDILIAKNPSRNDGANGEVFFSENEILHTRCLCSKDIPVSFEPKCILHISCRVIFWDIHGIEIEIFGCHLHCRRDIESHSNKCILYILSDLRNGVNASFFQRKRHRHVSPFCLKSCSDHFLLNAYFCCIEGILQGISEFVRECAYLGAFFWCEVFESLEDCRERSFFPENTVFVFYEGFFMMDSTDFVKCCRLEGGELFSHVGEIIFLEAL